MDQPLTKLHSYGPASVVAAKPVVERPDTTLLAEVASLISILTGKPVGREHAARLADGFAILDAYGRITFANPHFARHLGLGLEAVVGADLLADTPASSTVPLVGVLRSAQRGQPAQCNFAIVDREGRPRHLAVAAAPVPGVPNAHLVVAVRDRTSEQQASTHLAGLSAASQALTQTADFPSAAQVTLSECRAAVSADAAALFVVEESDGLTMTTVCTDGFSPTSTEFLRHHALVVGMGQAGSVAARGQARAVPDLRDAQLTYPEIAQREGLASAAFVPVSGPAGVSGVLATFTRRLRLFEEADLAFLTTVGSAVALALHTSRLRREIDRQARHDALTGLQNRPFFLELAGREYQRAVRQSATLALLMIAVDGFKRTNQVLGHAAGDRVLRAVTEALQQTVRAIDLVARCGGDEFAVLLPNCGESEARQIIGRLREKATETIAALDLALEPGPATGQQFASLTAGLAISTFAAGETLDTLMARAEADMYAAKGTKPGLT